MLLCEMNKWVLVFLEDSHHEIWDLLGSRWTRRGSKDQDMWCDVVRGCLGRKSAEK